MLPAHTRLYVVSRSQNITKNMKKIEAALESHIDVCPAIAPNGYKWSTEFHRYLHYKECLAMQMIPHERDLIQNTGVAMSGNSFCGAMTQLVSSGMYATVPMP